MSGAPARELHAPATCCARRSAVIGMNEPFDAMTDGERRGAPLGAFPALAQFGVDRLAVGALMSVVHVVSISSTTLSGIGT